MKKKVLFILATHGNESFSLPAFERLEKKYARDLYSYDWIIGNEKAIKKNVRYIDTDLNRSAPGDVTSQSYEERRAAEIIAKSKNYESIIDIHGTGSNSGIFILISNPTLENILLAASLPIKNVVVWASKKSNIKGPINQYTYCPALEIECGPKMDKEIVQQLEKIIKDFFDKKIIDLYSLIQNAKKQKYFFVYGLERNVDTTIMNEFEETTINGETFYPLLINAYEDGSVRKMKKLDLFDLLSG